MNLDEYYEKDQKLTEQEANDLIESGMVLFQHLDSILSKLHSVDKDAPYDIEDCQISINESGIDLNWEEDVGCCGYSDIECRSYYIPASYLWEGVDEIVAAAKERIKKAAEKKKRDEATRKIERENMKQQKEYEKYVELQKKFGDAS